MSARNPFVNSSINKLWLINETDENAHKIFKKQQFYKKEYGLQTVLLVSHFIRWKSPKKGVFYTSPLIFKPVQIIRNQKIKLTFDITILDENDTINPVIKDEFLNVYDIDLEIRDGNVSDFISILKTKLEINGDEVNLKNEWDDIEEWQIISVNAVGNFNYKKSILGQDYDHFITKPNAAMNALLGEGYIRNEPESIQLSNSDQSQSIAITKALSNNLVIQGPPGTGKSHTIVELIKQNLILGKKVLFVSEKRSALDVVYEKFQSQDLNYLVAYFNSEKNQKKEFYKNLKTSIQKEKETYTSKEGIDVKTEELEAYFHAYAVKQSKTNETDNTSIHDLVSYLAEHQVSDLEYDVKFKIPSYKLWFENIDFLRLMENIAISTFDAKSISDLSFLDLNKSIFLENNPLPKIETRLSEFGLWLDEINDVLKKYNLDWLWTDLSKYSLTASVLNMANKSQLEILDPSSKKYKSFDSWTKKYELNQNKLELSDELCAKWVVKPKLADIDEYIEKLKQNKGKSWLWFFKKSKIDTVFYNYKGDLSLDLKLKALNALKENYLLKSNQKELEIKLKHNLNILNPQIDINNLLHLRQKLDTLSTNQYVYLLEHDNSLSLIEDLHNLQSQIQKCNQIIKFLFVDFKPNSILLISKKIEVIRKEIPRFAHQLPEVKKLISLPAVLLSFIKENAYSIEELTKIITYHNYLNCVRFDPALKNLESIDIIPNFKSLKALKSAKNGKINTVLSQIRQKYDDKVNNLLNTPSSRLSIDEKESKKKEKLSKRIIYHEISKKQQHLPVKNLVKETNYSIFNIQPLWIMNPLSIAENLPCDENLFDVVIFDESSQIPLEDALPAIYRSKRVIVVGDSQQMPPSQFFSSSTESVTLLNQADSVFDAHLLTWHYRSEHPRLMQFSNQHFYDNELCYFPAITNNDPIELLKVNNGVFENGKNSIEAKKVAESYKELLAGGVKSVAIIAFSKEQQNQIQIELDKLNLDDNEDLIVRNLENTQGVEKDYVIISIGYGFNQEGSFRMSFGPLNQDYGGNRLNVLLTRAKKKMIVVTSVDSSDFKLSDNRGVRLLRDFLAFSECHQGQKRQNPKHFMHQKVMDLLQDKNIEFYSAIDGLAINCFVQHSSQKILLVDPCLNANESKDIYTILSVLDDRFKDVKILLSQDYWHNKTRFEKDLLNYF